MSKTKNRVLKQRTIVEMAGMAVFMALPLMLFVGCSGGTPITGTSTSTTSFPPAPMTGRVMGGTTAISGSTVNIYAAGSDYGSGATLLETETTNSQGEFSLTFPCSPVNKNIYITATGGNAGAGANSAIGLMLVAGDCTASNFPTSVTVNELTTVASVWATAAFNSTITSGYGKTIGGPPTGLSAAMAMVPYLVNESVGQPMSNPPAALSGTSAIPVAKLNTLANILASCVQTNGSSSTSCSTLFTNANLPKKPANTLEAALNMALNPANNTNSNIANLFTLASGGPFAPVLGTAPNTWTIALTWAGGGLNSPYGVAVDASGNVWATNAGTSGSPGTTISKLSPFTATWLSGASGYGSSDLDGPEGIAIDGKGTAWITNTCPGCSPTNLVTHLSATGATMKDFTDSTTLSGPLGVTVDQTGNIWVANTTASSGNNSGAFILSENAKGTATDFTAYTNANAGLSGPSGVAVDNSGNIWATNNTGTTITEYIPASGQFASYSSGSTPLGIGPDPWGNMWVVSNGELAEYNQNGLIITPSSVTSAGLSGLMWLASDSAGDIWATNNSGNSVTEIVRGGTSSNPAYTPYTFTNSAAPLSGPMGISIDQSGNVWVANNSSGATGTLTEFLSAAAPVQTPLIGVPGKPTPISGGGSE